jgi:hypothetical protein
VEITGIDSPREQAPIVLPSPRYAMQRALTLLEGAQAGLATDPATSAALAGAWIAFARELREGRDDERFVRLAAEGQLGSDLGYTPVGLLNGEPDAPRLYRETAAGGDTELLPQVPAYIPPAPGDRGRCRNCARELIITDDPDNPLVHVTTRQRVCPDPALNGDTHTFAVLDGSAG